MATISFDLVSPENLIFNDDVGTIIVPGKDGDLGVLPGHSQVMSSLRPGRVMVYSEDKNLVKSAGIPSPYIPLISAPILYTPILKRSSNRIL